MRALDGGVRPGIHQPHRGLVGQALWAHVQVNQQVCPASGGLLQITSHPPSGESAGPSGRGVVVFNICCGLRGCSTASLMYLPFRFQTTVPDVISNKCPVALGPPPITIDSS